MEIRGERECAACGARWSYYGTGEIACPECGSPRSVGVGAKKTHTAGTARFDLSPVRERVDEGSPRDIADAAADTAAEFLRTAGFVRAGELQPLDETYLAAAELRRVGTTLSRVMEIEGDERLYLLELLGEADDGGRPAPEAVPETLHPERGLAVARAVDAYLSDLRKLREIGDEPGLDRVLSAIRPRQKRIEALDGDVDPAVAERLVRAVRDVSRYRREGDEAALARAESRLGSATRL